MKEMDEKGRVGEIYMKSIFIIRGNNGNLFNFERIYHPQMYLFFGR